MTRIFRAARERVFDAWTDPKHVDQWFGPEGFSTTTHEMDVRPGGVWRFVMHGPGGIDYPNRILYDEVVRPERLAFVHGPDNEEFESRHFQVTVTFEDLGAKTRVTLRQLHGSVAARDRAVREFRAIEGGNQTLGRLEAYLEAK